MFHPYYVWSFYKSFYLYFFILRRGYIRVRFLYLFTGTLDDNTSRPYISRFKIWTNTGNSTLQQCYGKYVRDICIFGISDLPKLKNRTELFANKFNVDFEPLAYDCMEQNYFRKVQEEERGRGRGRNRFNVSFYTSLAFVKHQIEAQ